MSSGPDPDHDDDAMNWSDDMDDEDAEWWSSSGEE
jgi:hypothetical protein